MWRELGRHYTPPPSGRITAETATAVTLERIVFGLTVVELECERCHDIRGVELLGDARVGRLS